MTSILPKTYFDHVVSLAEDNGRLTAELIVARAELAVERTEKDELRAEIARLRARIATAETEAAIAREDEPHDPRERRDHHPDDCATCETRN